MILHTLRNQFYTDIAGLAVIVLLLVSIPLTAVSDTAPVVPVPQVEQAVVVQTIDPVPFPEIADRYKVMSTITLTVTAYSSTVDQTDSDPFTTASGSRVCDGTIAYNGLPFGTKVRFPDQFGDKVFVVMDRMHPRKGTYVADIWMETREAAIQWGAPIVRMEVLGA